MSPLLDLFVTLLSMGEEGYLGLLKKRKEVYMYFQTKLKEFCEKRQVNGVYILVPILILILILVPNIFLLGIRILSFFTLLTTIFLWPLPLQITKSNRT